MIVTILIVLLFAGVAHAQAPTFEHGKISALLHKQALSHLAFHSDPIKLRLASLFSPSSVAIVGVEWGQDVQLFANHGYHVYAVEPASKFMKHLETLVDRQDWNVTLVHAAAGETDGDHVEISYEDVREVAVMKRVDSVVSQRLAVLSVDIQGDELSVLRGSTGILEKGLVDSLWVEAIACNDKVESLLRMVDRDYVIFDFVPWGKGLKNVDEGVPRGRGSFEFDEGRPGGFEEYLSWMCELKKNGYYWLQTDFLMVRRELITDHVINGVQGVGEWGCEKEGSDCALRDVLKEEEVKDEL